MATVVLGLIRQDIQQEPHANLDDYENNSQQSQPPRYKVFDVVNPVICVVDSFRKNIRIFFVNIFADVNIIVHANYLVRSHTVNMPARIHANESPAINSQKDLRRFLRHCSYGIVELPRESFSLTDINTTSIRGIFQDYSRY